MDQQVVEYNITNAAIAKMENLYMGLTITDIKNDEEFTAVHDARMVVKNHRVSVEKKRKELKAEALAWGKKVDGEANRIKGLLEPIENHLASEEKKVTDEKERIKAEADQIAKEKIQSRVDTLFALNVIMPFSDLATMPDNEYSALLDKSQANFEDEQRRIAVEKAEKEAEAKRIEQIAREQATESARLSKIKEEQEAIAMAQKAKEEALKAQEKAIEDAKRKEIERQEQIAWQAHESERLRILAEADAAEKIEKEAIKRKEKEEAEVAEKARAEALRPDREKIIAWAKSIRAFTIPAVSNEKAQEIVANGLGKFMKVADSIIKQAQEL